MDIPAVAKLHDNYDITLVSKTISAGDVMFRGGRDWYFPVGQSAVSCILTSLALTRLSDVKRVLDLPCGYGRVARHLSVVFRTSELYFSDIDREAVDFCSLEFGGKGIYSELDLTRANLPQNIDVIWVGSLFTHLSRSKTYTWLSFLAEHLSPHGVLIATFHGYFTAYNPPQSARVDFDKLQREFNTTGFGFEEYPTDDAVQLGDYGFSIVKPSSILDMADTIPGTRVTCFTERGWASNHDVLTLCRDDRLKPFNL